MTITDQGARVLSRLSLMALTQALEELALMLQQADEEAAILAVFQHGRWFPPEHDRYARLAATGPVVVGFGDQVPDLPDDVVGTSAPGDVGTEWSLVVVSGPLCAALVTRDRRRDGRPTRAFVGGWTFRRHDALDEARRLLAAFGELPPATAEAVDRLVAAASSSPSDHPLAAPMPNREHPNEPFLATAAEQLVEHLGRTEDVTRRLLARLRIAVDDTDRDPVTLLHNRRYLEQLLEQRDESEDRRTLVVLSLDVLGMGRVNEEYGNEVGDEALRHVAECVTAELRDTDEAVRWTGDKFVAVLAGDDAHIAQSAAARIEAAISERERPVELQGVDLAVRIGSALADGGRSSFSAVEAALEDARGGATRA